MLVTMKLPDLAVSTTAQAQPTQLANLLANPLIDQYTRTNVTTQLTLAEKTSNGYGSSDVRSQY